MLLLLDKLLLTLLIASYYYKTLQYLLPNGKNGEVGLNAQPLVARGSESEHAHAVNQSLEATCCVLEMCQKLKNARHLSAQVIHCFIHGDQF